MSEGPAKTRLHEALLAQSAWMRRLAASLVRDAESADELVQDAWVATLRSPPREAERLRPFLGRVLQRLAARRWTLRERERRTLDLEAVSDDAAPANGPGADELAEQLESERALLDELHALSEPYRQTLILHYHSGLPLVEIARRLGLPAGTVRWRLHEGLEQLRARLDRRHGSRSSWCLALAGLHGWPEHGLTAMQTTTAAAASGAALTTGVLIVNTATKLVAGISAALAVALGVLLWTQDPQPKQEIANAPASSADTQAALAAPSSGPQALAPAEEAPREPRAVTESVASAPETSEVAAPAETHVLARVIDDALRPIGAARFVELVDGEPATRSSADGAVDLVLSADSPEGSQVFAVSSPGCATEFVELVVRRSLSNYAGDVVLRPGSSISGHVRDTAGRAVEGAEVYAVVSAPEVFSAASVERMRLEGPGGSELRLHVKSGVDGSYRLDGVPCSVLRVWAKSKEMRWSFSPTLEPVARVESSAIDLVLEPYASDGSGGPIEGRVLGPSNEPLANIRIEIEESQVSTGNRMTRSQHSEADGRFRVLPKYADAVIRLTFSDPEKRFAQVQLERVRPGSRDLEVQLLAPLTFEIDVRDDRGPVSDFRVRWADAAGRERGTLDRKEPHVDGRALLSAPREMFTLFVGTDQHEEKSYGPFDGRKTLPPLHVELRRLAGIRGRVLAAGKPVEGAQLLLLPAPTDTQVSINGYDSLYVPFEEAKTVSDAEGRFVLGLTKSGRYVIFADARGYARFQYGPLELDAVAGLSELEFALDMGGTLEGRVIAAKGRTPAGVIVAVNRADAAPRTQVVGPDGAYRFEHLTPGPYELKKVREEFTGINSTGMNNSPGAKPKAKLDGFVIQLGATTRRDLDLSEDEPAILEVALTLNGAAAKNWGLTLWPADTNVVTDELPSGTTDSTGHARIESERKGDVVVWLKPPPELASDLRMGERLTLRPGSNPWSYDIRVGSLEGRIASAAGSTAHYRVRRANVSGDEDLGTMFKLDPEGRFTLPLAPAGELVLERLDPQAPGETQWQSVGRATVTAAQTARIELP